MTVKSKTTGIVIGRFHVAELHECHRELLDYVNQHHEDMIVFLGVRNSPATETLPLSYDMRVSLIKEQYPDARVFPLPDMRDDVRWSDNLDSLIARLIPNPSPILYCGRDGFKRHYHGTNIVEYLDFQKAHVSGTAHRKYIGENPEVSSVSFRRGVIHAMQNLTPRIYLTVDIALLKNPDSVEVLLVKKPTEDLWRFPGGFVERGESFINAAKRELKEETGLIIESGAAIVGDFDIKDWRIRDAKNVSHKTVLVEGWHSWGTAKANDDVSEVKWFPLTEVANNAILLVMEEHHTLLADLAVKHRVWAVNKDVYSDTGIH